jgi:hypothetical protein
VRKVIDELKFVPNGSATTLKYVNSTYGLIIPDITNRSSLNSSAASKCSFTNPGKMPMATTDSILHGCSRPSAEC